MMPTKITVALLGALVIALSSSGAAVALRSISFSERAISLSAREFTFTAGEARIVCEVVLAVTLSSASFAKTAGSTIGSVEARVSGQERGAERCTGGTLRFLAGASTLKYLGFSGTLPAITGLNLQIVRLSALATAFGGLANCLFTFSILGTQRVSEALLRELTGPYSLESITVRSLGGLGCAAPEQLRAEGSFNLVSPREVAVTLGPAWQGTSTRSEERGAAVLTWTIEYNGPGQVNITELNVPIRWMIEAGLNCIRVFRRGERCRFKATAEAGARRGEVKTLLSNGAPKFDAGLDP